MFSILNAQHLQTGTVRGTVTDDTGAPLPGVNITATSPSLIGSSTDISDGKGLYRLPALPPGTYTITFELQGFKTVLRKDFVVRVGRTVRVSITMEIATIEEEVTVIAAAPMVDVTANKLSTTFTKESMENLPLNRNLLALLNLTPGSSGGGTGTNIYLQAKVIHGGNEISNVFQLDGVEANDPDLMDPGPAVEFEAMEEVEIVTGGLTAEIGNSSGSFINVVTKSGGNEFSGMVQTYYTAEGLNKVLFTDEQLAAYNISAPSFHVLSTANSAMFGGPIIKDKLWFFTSGGYTYHKWVAPFVPATLGGVPYDEYQPSQTYYSGFLKLTSMLSKNLRFFMLGNYNTTNTPYNFAAPRNASDRTQDYKQPNKTVTAYLSWVISKDTFLDIRGGWNDIRYYSYSENPDKYAYRDSYTGYQWGHRSREQIVPRYTYQASTRLTHFQDNFLGADHEFRVGATVYYGVSDWDWWMNRPIIWYYWDNSPYYYRGRDGLDEPHPTYGDGRIRVQNAGPESSPNNVNGSTIRLSFFLQDSMTIANRLTINIGLRVDDYNGWIPSSEKAAGGGISEAIGAAIFMDPLSDDFLGFNPFGAMPATERWDNCIDYTGISPRLGLVYDLFGDGKTALKASYSRYREVIGAAKFQGAHPFRQTQFSFNWWDLNENGDLDAPPIDRYEHYGLSPAIMLPEYWQTRIDPDISGPIYDEFIVGANHELVADLNVGFQYIYRHQENMINGIRYDPDTDRYWYTYEQATDWWVPFTTTVPAYEDFPAETVTMYFQSEDAPNEVTRLGNVPEAKKRYQALEFTFMKRMSNGWQLGGSVVLSKTEAYRTGSRGQHWGWSGAYPNASWWVNRYGRTGFDRPLMIKLYGTAELPLGFLASFFYTHFSGTPWQRTVNVVPPAAWTAANNAASDSFGVNVEASGTRRYPAADNVDFRLEKELNLDFGRLGLFVDIYNLLGHSYLDTVLNPGGTWRPTDENTTAGTYSPAGSYQRVTGLTGVRTFKLSVRFSF